MVYLLGIEQLTHSTQVSNERNHPIRDAVADIQERFGINVMNTDMNKMKANLMRNR